MNLNFFSDEHVEQPVRTHTHLQQHPPSELSEVERDSFRPRLQTAPAPAPATLPYPYSDHPGLPPPTPTSSDPDDLHNSDRVFGPPAVARSYGPPVVIEGPYRRVPDFPPLPPYQQPVWELSMNPAMQTDFRDELARLDGVITPGVDNTPFVQYAIEALTSDRDTGYSTSSMGPGFAPGQQQQQHHHHHHHQQQQQQQQQQQRQQQQQHQPQPQRQQQTQSYPPARPHQPPPAPNPLPARPPVALHHAETAFPDPGHHQLPRPFIPGPRESAHSLADTLLKKGSRPPQPHEWRPVERDELLDRAPELPTLNYRPWPLRAPALFGFMVLCVLVIAALILSAVYSQLHQGLLAWETIHGGRYFLFRIFPQLVGAAVLLYAQFLARTVFRILPFAHLASAVPEHRHGALFQELYPSFLWPSLVGPWNVWVPMLVTWLMNFTLPLQSSLFTVILVGQTWTWATVQAVAWTLVALYLALLVSTIIVWRYWATLESTGLVWDSRSLADIATLVSETNTAEDYRGTQLARSRDGIRFALRRRADDRLCYWTWKDGRHGFWHTLGSPMDEASIIPVPDLTAGQRMKRHDEKHGGGGGLFASEADEHHDIETRVISPAARHRYLPWCLRTSQLLWLTLGASALLLAIFIVSFLPSTRILAGFSPSLKADPQHGAFSPADFFYSFFPALLGMLLFLAFQPLDNALRVLQPWASLSHPRGSPAECSLLADYAAASLPGVCTVRALRNRHWRVAAISLLSDLFVLVPVLAGGAFMALTITTTTTNPDGKDESSEEVRIYPNTPAYALLLALLVLYLLALLSFFPARKPLRMPHAVTCLAEIVGYLAVSSETRDEPAFKRCVSRDEMVGKMVGRGNGQSWWAFGFGGEGAGEVGDGELGVRRVRRFTEKRRVRKSQIRRGVLV